MNYEHLLKPLTIRGKTYRNRIIAAPTGFASFLLSPMCEGMIAMVKERAKGGAASVTVGEHMVTYGHLPADKADGKDVHVMPHIIMTDETSQHFELMKDVADAVKSNGALAFMELAHPGNGGDPDEEFPVIYGPVEFTRPDGVHVEAINEDNGKEIIEAFVRSALFCKKAGFDGIFIHGGHGFLITQMLSPLSNNKDGVYGGTLEKRMRFPLELLKAVREAVGEDMLIEMRLSGAERMEGGTTAEDMAEFGSHLSGLVDVLHISSGHYYHSYRTWEFSSMYNPHGCNMDLADVIRKKLPKDVYMGVVGGFNSAELGEKVIKDNRTDFIILGRQEFADPEFANKVANGQAHDIQSCLRCLRCYAGSVEHKLEEEYIKKHGPSPIPFNLEGCYCTINPASRGFFAPSVFPKKAEEIKNVLVIGGGIAGLMAADTLRKRGHEVVLAEKNDYLGGVLKFTEHDLYKKDLLNYRNLLINRVKNNGTKILTGKEITPEELSDIMSGTYTENISDEKTVAIKKPDVVIIAIGAQAAKPSIPGLEKVLPATDAYEMNFEKGSRVVIAGGGLVGCDTAVELAERGCDVTVVEMLDRVANEAHFMQFTSLMDKMEELDIRTMVSTACTAIEESNGEYFVKVKNVENGMDATLVSDNVFYCFGMKAKTLEVDALKGAIKEDIPCFVIGDADIPARVGDATFAAYNTALKI